ncbi:hypothetical protein [Cellulomonas sp. Leaf334]|uniref:hypothetical protein n=1 Tax=Cellulomonas sp. Leaf334 TaxID=1736339 RepID=UPI0006FB7C82|nr:hypothetical protein [Cellulomonas sp. Leaf334]KQR17106.1 hypothetical protein ASF78_07275 [Cellulomonas sp. Leaf334]
MSPDLTRALHDAVDTGPDDSPFSVDALTGRIRRRRTVRAASRGGVAVGAAGAVALGAVWMGGRAPSSALPAARPDAAQGTCGSPVAAFPPATGSPVTLLPGTSDPFASVGALAPGESAARLTGRTFVGQVAVALSPEQSFNASAVAQGETEAALQQLQAALALARRQAAAGRPTLDAQGIAELEGRVARAGEANADASAVLQIVGPDAIYRRDLQLLLAHGSTVVAVGGHENDDGEMFVQGETALRTLELGLQGCDESGDLPPGTYDLYVAYDTDSAGGAEADRIPEDRALAGPWTVDLLAAEPQPTGLPSEFPTDELPLAGGRLVSAERLSPSPTSGWRVVVEVDGDDALRQSVELLALPGHDTTRTVEQAVDGATATTSLEGSIAGWDVTIAAELTEAGDQSITYTFVPTTR